jgi:hypothetical protein
MGNVYAANQVVDTTKSPTTFIEKASHFAVRKFLHYPKTYDNS